MKNKSPANPPIGMLEETNLSLDLSDLEAMVFVMMVLGLTNVIKMKILWKFEMRVLVFL